jgi:hypothetical protein
MTIIKCDRCGERCNEGNPYHDCRWFHLCEDCYHIVWEFIRKSPKKLEQGGRSE